MHTHLKPLAEQSIVITGASSGIGLVTAKRAARRGARVTLIARNRVDLDRAVDDIRRDGGRAIACGADVTDRDQLEAAADAAVSEFGGIDTWVNNAGVSIYGRLVDVPIDEMRQQFEVVFWGQVHGSLAAVKRMRSGGGALINVASAVADRAIPLQAAYSAAKHAVKGFTDALRMELERDGIPISISLIKPSSTDTPLFQKARVHFGVEPQPIPPVYSAAVVADAILRAAEHPIRDLTVGAMGKVMSVAGDVAPRLTDRYMERSTFDSQKTDVPIGDRPDNLFAPVQSDGGERGHYGGHVMKSSAYTASALHPAAAALAGLGLGAVVVGGLRLLQAHRDGRVAAEVNTDRGD